MAGEMIAAEPIPLLRPAGITRAYYLDYLKMVLCSLVIIHHTAIAYGAMGGWCYLAPELVGGWTRVTLSTLLAVNQAFFMSLFFCISAYLLPNSVDRKGPRAFLKQRALRLGVPLLVYTFLVHPSLLYAIRVHTHTTTETWHKFFWSAITETPNTGHMWFVLALLVFECSYVGFRSFSNFSVARFTKDWSPSHWHVVGFVLACSALAFALRQRFPIGSNIVGVQLGFFGLYIGMYGLGIVAKRNGWFDRLSFANVSLWFFFATVLLPFIVSAIVSVQRAPDRLRLYVGGLHWEALLLTLWESVTCVGICGFLWVSFRQWANLRTRLSRFSPDTYALYVIHPLLVVGATMLLEPVPLTPLAKFFLVSFLGIIGGFMIAHGLRRLPGVARVL
jgi:glucans biosynthesis protein C